MTTKRKIKARDIVNDIRAGLTNLQIMEKYDLSSKGLTSIFTKLIDARAVKQGELDGRIPLASDTVALDQKRVLPRNYVLVRLPVVETNNPESSGHVRDVTEKGLQITGIPAEVGEIKKFTLMPENFNEAPPFSLEAECRWSIPGDGPGQPSAGFEITNISKEDVVQLRNLIKSLTFGD